MKFVVALLAGLTMSQVACAKPNYQDVAPLAKQEAKPGPAACPIYFTTEDLCASYSWRKAPTEQDFGSFALSFFKKDGTAADPQMTLKIVIWMPDMGHGSSPVKITKKAVGSYVVDNVFFSMHGDWQIRFQLLNAAAVAEEQVADVTF